DPQPRHDRQVYSVPIHVQLDNFHFEPTTGFFDLGDDLDGSVLRDAPAGQPFVLLGDVDGDGRADLAFNDSALAFSDPPKLRVVSGLSGATISSSPGLVGAGTNAWLADAGDLDGDGLDDLAIGAPLAVGSGGNQGLVSLRSAATGALLMVVEAPDP